MRLLTVLALVAGLIMIPAGMACACSCAPFEAKRGVADAEAIFTGTVTDVRAAGGQFSPVVATIKADQIYKGSRSATFEVTTADNSAACGYDFAVNRRYLVFAHATTDDSTTKVDGVELTTGLCSGNVLLANGGGPLSAKDLPKDTQDADKLLTELGTPTTAEPGTTGAPVKPGTTPTSGESANPGTNATSAATAEPGTTAAPGTTPASDPTATPALSTTPVAAVTPAESPTMPSPMATAPVSEESPLPAMGIGIGIGAAILLSLIVALRLRLRRSQP